MMKPLKQLFAPRNRGLLLDVFVFVFNLIAMRLVVRLCLNLLDQADTDNSAKLTVGLFFAGLFLLQPLGPILKRWSFHQRNPTSDATQAPFAGCFLFFFMFVYLAVMIIICGAATIILSESLFERGSKWSELSVVFLLFGFAISVVNAIVIYRYFLKPKHPPRFKFLESETAEVWGDVCMFFNTICFQILLGCVTASGLFWESLDPTSHGQHAGMFGTLVFRLIFITGLALLLYVPPRIFYLLTEPRRKITILTMFLANLPLIVSVMIYSQAQTSQWNAATQPASTRRQIVAGKSTYVLSAQNLWDEYNVDAQAGAKKYAGQAVMVTGIVQTVSSNANSTIGNEVRLDGGGRFRWVICSVDDTSHLSSIAQNQAVTLQCAGERFWLGGPRLAHCTLVNSDKTNSSRVVHNSI